MKPYVNNEQPYETMIDSVGILWRRGKSTWDISKMWGVPECVIWRALMIYREKGRKQ